MRKKLINCLLALFLLGGCAVHAEEADESSAEADAEYNKSTYACRAIDSYDYMSPVPYSDPIEESYYDTTLFAGDSRMGSLWLYGNHENAEIYYVTSLNLLLIDTMTIDEEELSEEQKANEEELTLLDVLKASTKDNIYLLFGINEIRNPNFTAYAEQLQEIVTMLRENNPDVNVYIILSYHPDLINGLPEPDLTEHLLDLNGEQIAIAQNNHLFYLNLDDGLNDEEGTVIDNYVYDGLHFTITGTNAFEDYIATHVVRKDLYVKEICE